MAFVVPMRRPARGPALSSRRGVDVMKVAVWIAGALAPWAVIILAARFVIAALA